MRVPRVVVVAALLLTSACGGDKAAQPDSTVPKATSTTTAGMAATTTPATAAPSDPFAVPAVIDAPYVNRVLAILDHVQGEVLRDMVANNVVNESASERFRAIYTDLQLEEELTSLVKGLGGGLAEFKRPPGDRHSTVIDIVATSPTCILARIGMDYSSVVTSPPTQDPGKVDIVTLRPTRPGTDPGGLNPTRWSIDNAEIIKVDAAPPARAECSA